MRKTFLKPGHPNVAVSFKDGVLPEIINKTRQEGMDIAELRVDLFSSSSPAIVLKEINKFKNVPVLATIRSRKEGGKWKGSETARLALYQKLIPKADAVDIELSSSKINRKVISAARKAKKTVILSFHDFKKTPPLKSLYGILNKAKALGADIVKIAALIKKPSDLQTLAEFTLANSWQKIIVIGMGEKGSVSRVAFPCFGSLLTFAHIGEASAPGQLDLPTTIALLKKLQLSK